MRRETVPAEGREPAFTLAADDTNLPARVRIVGFRQPSHEGPTGYPVLMRHARSIIRAAPLSKSVVPERVMWRLANRVIAYDWEALATELKAAGDLLTSRGAIYHVLNVENTYHYLGLLNGLWRNRVVATFHLPPANFHRVVRTDWHIRRLSAAICIGRSQMDDVARVVGAERTFFVPHGVDAEYFSPPADDAMRDPNHCLFVGNHLRDYATLRHSLDDIAHARPAVRCVALNSQLDPAADAGRPLLLPGRVSLAELRRHYQRASVLMLPLLDVTGSNAIVEALACGLPIVTTDVGSIRDYVTPACAVLVPPGDAAGMAAAVIALLDDPKRVRSMSLAARQQALTLDWPALIPQLRAVYDAVT